MHKYHIDEIKTWLKNSLQSLAYVDHILLKRRVKEECINHRLARSLELCYSSTFHDEFPTSLDIDLEYNKNVNEGPKMLEIENGSLISIRPDIVFHNRLNNSCNVLAIEAKLGYLRNGDKIKLKGLIQSPYSYFFSAGVSYLPEKKYFRVSLYSIENGMSMFDVPKEEFDWRSEAVLIPALI